MEDLKKKYDTKSAEYDRLIQQAIATKDASQIPRIRQLNTEIGKLLDEMISQLTFLKKDTPMLKRERDILVERLQRIQKDYNGLLVNTDQLETLRRIRQQEGGDYKRQLYRYLMFFFILCIGVLLLLLFVKGGQKKESTETSAATPNMTPPLI